MQEKKADERSRHNRAYRRQAIAERNQGNGVVVVILVPSFAICILPQDAEMIDEVIEFDRRGLHAEWLFTTMEKEGAHC